LTKLERVLFSFLGVLTSGDIYYSEEEEREGD